MTGAGGADAPSTDACARPGSAAHMVDDVPAIDLVDVVKDYPGTRALRGVSLRLAHGELFGLVGPDGAGKTTLLRTLAGLLRLTSGQVRIDGIDVQADPAAAKERIGYMSQRFSLSETLTVAENLFYVSEVWHVPHAERRQRMRRLLDFSRLAPFQDRQTRNLSGGMKQKLSLCVSLVHQPRILLLDEPTIGVDPISRRDFWLILYDLLAAGSTILLSTPYMDEAERCGRVGFLLDGRVIACGPPAELRASLGTVVLDLHCQDSRAARASLRQIGGLGDAVWFGEHLHIAVPRAGADVRALVEAVRAAGVDLRGWRVREPSLEDVFLAYTRRAPDTEAPA